MVSAGGLTRNLLANYFGQCWAALMAIAFLPIYIAHLGLEAYGLIGFFAVMQSLLVLFDLGLTPALTREAASFVAAKHTTKSIRDLIRSVECIAYAIAVVLVACICVFANTIAATWMRADHLSDTSITRVISFMSIVLAARLLEGVYRGILMGLERQVAYNVLNAALATIRYAGAIVVLEVATVPLDAFFIWQAAMSLVSLATLAGAAYAVLPAAGERGRFSLPALRLVWRFSAGMAAVSSISLATANVDKILLSGLLLLDEFGKYALASVAASTLYTLLVPVTLSVYPRLVGHFATNNITGIVAAHRISSQLATVLAGSAGLCLAMFSTEVIYVWSGDAVLAKRVAPLLSILSLAAIANCFGHLGSNLQQARGATFALVWVNAFALVSAVVLLPWAARQHGSIGAAEVWFAIASVQAIITLGAAHVGTLRSQGVRWLLRDLLLPLAGAGALAGAAYLLRPDLTTGRLPLGIFLALTSCMSAFMATMLAADLRIRFYEFVRSRKKPMC